ncbi:MAG: flagellar hook-length control protein FliK [Burkholderiales bacterium]|nr:flagellar hook-length control protein FliK [Burkholderiales bacterium]
MDAQLDAWVSRELVWHGQAWPGQPVALTVGEHAQHAGPYGDAAASWRSRLVLELPQLGPVELELHLAGNGVRVARRAVSGTAADALAGARDELVDALAARGLETRSVLVQNDDG